MNCARSWAISAEAPAVTVGLDTFTASNLEKITLPDGIVDVTLSDVRKDTTCDLDTATGKSSCLTAR